MSLLTFTERGIYCAQGDFYIDPWKPVARAIITHAHSDHARSGMKHYLCHTLTAPIIKHRLGQDCSVQSVAYNEPINLYGVQVSLHPAGHIPGSAQVKVVYKDEVWVVSGDYKTTPDKLCDPFEPVKCHHFITESTFGLPVFRWPSEDEVAAAMNAWWQQNALAGKTSVIFAYALGKAQRISGLLNRAIGQVYAHGAVANVDEVLLNAGLDIPVLNRINPDEKVDFSGAMVIAPPSAMGTAWMKRFKQPQTAFASGWMMVRGTRRRRNADRGFVLSDHADWVGLNEAVEATGAENIYVTHGYSDIFAKYLTEKGKHAQVVRTSFMGESDDSAD